MAAYFTDDNKLVALGLQKSVCPLEDKHHLKTESAVKDPSISWRNEKKKFKDCWEIIK